ncbi:hypothetical protein [Endozoicomonas sp. 2B-B]
MDKVVGENIFPGEYSSPYSKTEYESPSEAMKYLSEAKNDGDSLSYKDLSSRYVAPVTPEKGNDNHHFQLAKNIVATLDPVYFDSIDDDSWKNMADSLKFSGINSLEKATAMDLKVCPPCPVFHTWVALHGTTIFNGKNNPRTQPGINYIQRILEEATNLSRHDIPLFIVFSDMNLTKHQIQEMKDEFKNHDNILCISFESDLQLKLPIQLQNYASSMGIMFMDSIRIAVSQNITKTISFCIDKAKSENKTDLVNRFEKLGSNHLFYSDIDNQWLSKPPYILASHGTFTQPIFSRYLPLNELELVILNGLSDKVREHLRTHRSFFIAMPHLNKYNSGNWSIEKARNLSDYILSGEAQSNYEYLVKQIADVASHYVKLLKYTSFVFSKGDNSCLFLAEHSKDFFLEGALKAPCVIDLHQNPDIYYYNKDPYYREAHNLVGMQLLKYHYHGHDKTWVG